MLGSAMAERKLDRFAALGKDALSIGIEEDRTTAAAMGFVDDSKDQQHLENSIPLSPQWLYAKPSDTKDETPGEKQTFPGRLLPKSDSRDKWRPRHRQETGRKKKSNVGFAPASGFARQETGRVKKSYVGFAPGRGRANPNSVPSFSSPSSAGLIGAPPVYGRCAATVGAFRYPRGKLLDIYRQHEADEWEVVKSFEDGQIMLEEVPPITLSTSVQPLAFLTPDNNEEVVLADIRRVRIISSEATNTTALQKERNKELEAFGINANKDNSAEAFSGLPRDRLKSIVSTELLCMDDASAEALVMPFDVLREITNDFAEERKLGSGSFGKVYMGVQQDGGKIAVKMLYDMPGLDDELFQNEFKNLTRLRHQNIVRLVGYCHDIQEVQVMHEGKLVLAEKTHRALCLEYMCNGSLDKYLSDECDRYDWPTCYGIVKGICQGLKYLHNELKPPIYHLDLKPANVLLDENMVPRIADFGMSRLFRDEQTRATKSSLGTIGYLPPEYIYHNLISNKFDIFSMGVVIIKIMAGRAGYFSSADMSSEEFINLVWESWMNRLLETSNLRRAYSEQVKICVKIGLSCLQEDRHKRPTIHDIVDRLNETRTEHSSDG